MIKTFAGLVDSPLESWFASLLKDELGFVKYYRSPGQIALQKLDPSHANGLNIELDAIIRLNKTCIILEYTGQGGSFRTKIESFITNAHLFHESAKSSLRKCFEQYGVPEHDLDDMEAIDNWKFVYIGTHDSFENKKYSREDFPDHRFIRDRLYILYPSDIEYLRQLCNLIGKFSKNEFLARLEVAPRHLGDEEESIHLPFIKAEGKYITGNIDTKADVYLVKFKVDQLLKIARVSRYEGIPFILESNKANENYQRMLIDDKLNSIATAFVKGNKRKTFPNTITIALSDECVETGPDGNKRLSIPKKFSSIDIIDGQHRLFGYTQPEVTDEIRENAEILASAIRFDSEDHNKNTRNAAKVFCEINSTQAQVKKDLLYLIKYDVLGDTDTTAIAGKIILECNKRSGALEGMFLTSSLKRKNQLNLPPIPITNIIDTELVPLLEGHGIDGYMATEDDFQRVFEDTKANLAINPEGYYSLGRNLLMHYFNITSSVFTKDWDLNAETNLITEEYFSALIRFLRFCLFNGHRSINEMRDILLTLKGEIDKITLPETSPSLPKANPHIPAPTKGVAEIFEFFRNPQAHNPAVIEHA
jgi:DGQHR domain-containing protein